MGKLGQVFTDFNAAVLAERKAPAQRRIVIGLMAVLVAVMALLLVVLVLADRWGNVPMLTLGVAIGLGFGQVGRVAFKRLDRRARR